MYPGSTVFHGDGYFQFPLWLGDDDQHPTDVFRDLTAVRDGRASLADLEISSELGGLKVCKVSLTFAEGKTTHWIDLARGCVPVRTLTHYHSSNSDVVMIFDRVEHLAGAGWLPRRRTTVTNDGALVERIDVTEVDTANRPDQSIFQLDYPEPMRVYDRVRKLGYAPQKTWSLLHRPGRNAPGTVPVVAGAFHARDEMPGERENPRFWLIAAAGGCAILLAIGSVALVRKRRAKLEGR